MEQSIDQILVRLEGVRKNGTGWMAKCPCHDDRTPSLRVWIDNNGRIAFHCFAGCEHERVRLALGIESNGGGDPDYPSFYRPKNSPSRLQIVAKYRYVDEIGNWLYTVGRTEKDANGSKHFPTWRPDIAAKTGISWGLGDTRRVLYQLPAVLRARDGRGSVWIAEGEKDVDALRAAGVTATCNPHGAGKWRSEFNDALRGAAVTIVADRDAPGRKHAAEVAASLQGVAASVRVVEAATGKDAYDHLSAGKTLEEFVPFGEPIQANETQPERKINVITATQLATLQVERPQYILFGYLARGVLTQLAAKMKVGKTRFVLDAVASIVAGDEFIGHSTEQCAVLYLTEEGAVTFRNALDRVGLLSSDRLHILLKRDARELQWDEIGEQVREYIIANRIGLVVVDTLAAWCGLRGDEENSAGSAEKVLSVLRWWAEAGAAVLSIRHEGKVIGDIVDSGRGSTAVGAGMDILCRISRPANDSNPRRRVLEAVGRFDWTPADVVLELVDERYELIGQVGEESRVRSERAILDVIPICFDEAITLTELIARSHLQRSTAQRVIGAMVQEGKIVRAKSPRPDGRGTRDVYWIK